MNGHLRSIAKQAGPDKHIVLMFDQAGWHTAKGLKVLPNVTLHHLPLYSPDLNPIEREWA